MGLKQTSIVLERDEFLRLARQADSLASSTKNQDQSEKVAFVYKDGVLYLRAESNLCILQLSMDAEKGPDEFVYRAAMPSKKLVAALRQVKEDQVTVQLQKTGVKFGKGIRVSIEDPVMFGKLPESMRKAEKKGDITNPYPYLERAAHCIAKEKSMPLTAKCVTVLPNHVLAAWVDQSIMIDCKLLPKGHRMFLPGQELLRIKELGEFLSVRLSKDWLVLSSGSNFVAIRAQKEPPFVERVLSMFQNVAFVDQFIVDRDELAANLKTASGLLGKHAIITATMQPDGKINWHGEEEGNEFEFTTSCERSSDKRYFFGVEVMRLQNAINNSPFDEVIFKIEELDVEGSTRLNLVDNDSHEIISLDTVHALRELTD